MHKQTAQLLHLVSLACKVLAQLSTPIMRLHPIGTHLLRDSSTSGAAIQGALATCADSSLGSGDLTEAGASVAACDRSGDNPDSGLEPRRRGPGVSLRPQRRGGPITVAKGAPAAAYDQR